MKRCLLHFSILLTVLFGLAAGLSAQSNDMLLKRDVGKVSQRLDITPSRRISKAPALQSEGGKVIRTALLSKNSWIDQGQMASGMYEYSADSYSSTCLHLNPDIDPTGGATYIGDGKYFTTAYTIRYGMTLVDHYIVDASTWETISRVSGTAENIARDLTYDKFSGKMYGCFRDDSGDGYVFGTLDPNNAEHARTVICTLSQGWNALSVDKNGTLYALDRDGALYTVDKGSGVMTKVGDTGLQSKYMTSGAIDPETNQMYFVTCDDTASVLYTIDLQNAKASMVYELTDGEQVGGMYIPETVTSVLAPAAPTGLAASIDDDSKSGMFLFTAPSTYTDGTPLTGQLNFTISVKGETIASGTVSPGEMARAIVTLNASGSYLFIVNVTDAQGNVSEDAYLEKYIGYDCPEAVASVDAMYFNGRFIISWPAPTRGVYGGTFNVNDVTYTLVRMPDNVVVADGISTTNVMDMVPETTDLVSYRYMVTPHNHDADGAPTWSAPILLGAKVPPYEVNFDTRDNLENITIVDANNDGRYWLFDGDCMYLYPTSVTTEDDYIFSVPLQLEAGTLYKMTAYMGARYAQYGNKESFDLKLATSPDPDGCIRTLLEPTTVSVERGEFSCTFQVEKSGKYYVAIHGCSEPDTFGMLSYGMSVRQDANVDAPDAPELVASADMNGGRDVAITITAPSTLLNGETLESIDKIELLRDNLLLTTFDTPAAGAELTYTDKNVAEGLHVYSAIAYNDKGAGKVAEAKAFVGINVPGAPNDAVAVEQDDHRTVKITWRAPETDVDGCAINPANVTYTVARYNGATMRWDNVAEGLKECAYSETLSMPQGTQVFQKYGIFAETPGGKNNNDVCVAPIVAVGDPYQMPYVETFGGTTLAGILGEENENEGASWQIWNKEDADGDGYCLFYTGAIDKKGSMFTGKINISGKDPVFSFWYWSIPTSESEEIVVEVNDGTGYKQIGVTPMNRGGEAQHWEPYTVSLEDYLGKDVQIRLSYITRKYVLYIDNLRVCNQYKNNLNINAIRVPTKMDPGTPGNIDITVENSGDATSGDYIVELYCNDVMVQSGKMPALQSTEKVICRFLHKVDNLTPESVEYYAVLNYDDENQADNISEKKSSMVLHRDYPVVTDLAADRQGSAITLTWTKPDMNCGDVTITDGAEQYVPFSVGFATSMLDNDYVGDWTMYDGDEEGSNGLAGFAHDNIAPDRELSFIVFNPAELGIVNSAWQPRSGDHAFVCLCAPTSANDDWMISPLLSGAQTVSFYAKSVDQMYPERFEFLYSMSGTDVKNFVKLAGVDNVPAQWTEYRYEIPEGVKYFAIRCTSERQFAFFVDDITFTRANPAAGLKLMGYNIYRDNQYLCKVAADQNSYTETDDKAHSYLVTAVYDRGESVASNEALVGEFSSVRSIQTGSIRITGTVGSIIIEGAGNEMIQVFGTDGKAIYCVDGSDRTDVKVAAGLYIVRVGDEAAKVMVR